MRNLDGTNEKDCVLFMPRLKIVSGLPYKIVVQIHEETPPHKEHFCGRLLLEDWKRSEKDRRVYLLHSLRLTLFFCCSCIAIRRRHCASEE